MISYTVQVGRTNLSFKFKTWKCVEHTSEAHMYANMLDINSTYSEKCLRYRTLVHPIIKRCNTTL